MCRSVSWARNKDDSRPGFGIGYGNAISQTSRSNLVRSFLGFDLRLSAGCAAIRSRHGIERPCRAMGDLGVQASRWQGLTASNIESSPWWSMRSRRAPSDLHDYRVVVSDNGRAQQRRDRPGLCEGLTTRALLPSRRHVRRYAGRSLSAGQGYEIHDPPMTSSQCRHPRRPARSRRIATRRFFSPMTMSVDETGHLAGQTIRYLRLLGRPRSRGMIDICRLIWVTAQPITGRCFRKRSLGKSVTRCRLATGNYPSRRMCSSAWASGSRWFTQAELLAPIPSPAPFEVTNICTTQPRAMSLRVEPPPLHAER